MADEAASNPGNDPVGPHSYFQNFQHTPVGARVPEKIGRGVFSTAVMVLQTHEIFLLDFLSMMAQPQQVVARIVMTSFNFSQYLAALRVNVGNYESQFGPLVAHPMPAHPVSHPGAMPPAPPLAPGPGPAQGPSPSQGQGLGPTAGPGPGAPSMPAPAGHTSVHPEPPPPTIITDLYEQMKFPEELLGGVFANAVMIRHTPEEFCFDFISNFFPRPMVVARVFAAAGRIPSLLDAMFNSLQRYQQGGGGPLPPVGPPPVA